MPTTERRDKQREKVMNEIHLLPVGALLEPRGGRADDSGMQSFTTSLFSHEETLPSPRKQLPLHSSPLASPLSCHQILKLVSNDNHGGRRNRPKDHFH